MAQTAARPSLRLPAPPPSKRLRITPVQAEPALPPDEPLPSSAPRESDVAEEPEPPEAALPNDAMVALLLLKNRFPVEAKVAPFATRAQLYTLLNDRTAADRSIEELRRANSVRLFQLPAGGRGDDLALMLTSDYVAALRRCRQQLLQKQQQQSEQRDGCGSMPAPGASSSRAALGSSSSSGGGSGAPAAVAVFGWFASRVLPACTEVMITHGELLELLQGPTAPGARRTAGPGGMASSGTSAGPQSGRQIVTDAHISLLLSHGFLTRHTASADSYLFSMPNAGAAVRSVAAGRQEILSLLQRRRHPELLESELEKRKLQRSVLGARWHVADMVGGGTLLRITTPVGPLLRVAKRTG